MAEMSTADSGGGKKKGGKVRSKKMSTRIDFTPMVDLGFLLITFFMLTTTLAKPQIMAVVMPEKKVDKEDLEKVKQSKVLTLLLGDNNMVYWYEFGDDDKPVLDSTDYSADGIRKVILNKMDKVNKKFGLDKYVDDKTKEDKTRSFIMVLIKPTKDAVYKNLVDALDEMAITKVSFYAVLDASEAELRYIKNPAAGLDFSAEAQADALTNPK